MARIITALALVGIGATTVLAAAPDWPQWRGPKRDGLCAETGLLADWPEGGPPLLWKVSGLGKGFSTVSIVGNRIYTMGDREGKQFILALDLATQKEVWAAPVGEPWKDGTRSTPTFDDGLLYAVGTHGDLVCVQAADGKEVWRKSYPKDFGGKMMSVWGFSESPLVDGDKVLCTPGARDAALAALDKKDGRTIWKCAPGDLGPAGKDGAGYGSINVAEACGIRQYLTLTGKGLVSAAAADGKFLWGYNRIANGTANISDPIVRGNEVFCSSAYKTGAALVRLSPAGGGIQTEEVHFLDPDTFQNHHGGMVLLGDYVYGGHGQNAGEPVCIEFKTGKVMWRGSPVPGRGSAAVLYAEGRLYLRYEGGSMALVEATPKEFRLKGTFKIAVKNGPSWPHPVIHDGKLYLRDHDDLVCYDIKKK